MVEVELLTVSECAAAWRVSPQTVTEMCRRGELPAIRVGNGRGQWRIDATGPLPDERTSRRASAPGKGRLR